MIPFVPFTIIEPSYLSAKIGFFSRRYLAARTPRRAADSFAKRFQTTLQKQRETRQDRKQKDQQCLITLIRYVTNHVFPFI
jgi:hypothetical protein